MTDKVHIAIYGFYDIIKSELDLNYVIESYYSRRFLKKTRIFVLAHKILELFQKSAVEAVLNT